MEDSRYDYDLEKVSYDDLKEILACGREIEFYYKGVRYSITHVASGFSLCRYHSLNPWNFPDDQELLKKARIDGKSLKEIWGEVTVEEIF